MTTKRTFPEPPAPDHGVLLHPRQETDDSLLERVREITATLADSIHDLKAFACLGQSAMTLFTHEDADRVRKYVAQVVEAELFGGVGDGNTEWRRLTEGRLLTLVQ